MIPSVETCYQLMDKYQMLDNIKEHSLVVASVAKLLAGNFSHPEKNINLDLVITASLLHDIAKTQCLDGACEHAQVGKEICLSHDFQEIAEIVAEHVYLKSNGSGLITEKEIVYYADKRVNHDEIVSLHGRLDYILERYGGSNGLRHESIQKNFNKCLQLEKRIFDHLDFRPAEVVDLVEQI